MVNKLIINSNWILLQETLRIWGMVSGFHSATNKLCELEWTTLLACVGEKNDYELYHCVQQSEKIQACPKSQN